MRAREAQGRDYFRLRYLAKSRDAVRDCREECCDGAMYAIFEVLRNRRDGADEQLDLALETIYHLAQAHQTIGRMRLKERGRPG